MLSPVGTGVGGDPNYSHQQILYRTQQNQSLGYKTILAPSESLGFSETTWSKGADKRYKPFCISQEPSREQMAHWKRPGGGELMKGTTYKRLLLRVTKKS